MQNEFFNPFTPQSPFPRKRIFGKPKIEKEESLEPPELLETEEERNETFDYYGFELKRPYYLFITSLERQILKDQRDYPLDGDEDKRAWTKEEIIEILKQTLKYSTIQNKEIVKLNINSLRLTKLPDISNLVNLTELSCYNNKLDSLDVSNLDKLTYLSCSNNQLDSLDVSNLDKLTHLSCSNNQLDSLDVSNLTALTHLSCNDNKLRTLDVSNLTKLTYLSCSNNKLSEQEKEKIKQKIRNTKV